jgi:hypothetical protein
VSRQWEIVAAGSKGLEPCGPVGIRYERPNRGAFHFGFYAGNSCRRCGLTSHTIAILLRITTKTHAEATRQFRDGNLNGNPLTLALIEQGGYVVASQTRQRITLIDILTEQRYSGPVPAELVEFLASFQGGVRVLKDHEFELILESDD